MTPKKLLDFGEVDTMNREQFDAWWDGKEPDSTANPYRKDTPAFWAWAGWKAGVMAEREACAKIADEASKRKFPWGSENADIYHAQARWAEIIAENIRARGDQ